MVKALIIAGRFVVDRLGRSDVRGSQNVPEQSMRSPPDYAVRLPKQAAAQQMSHGC